MGSQANPFDFHRNIFDGPSLTAMLEQVGFTDIRPWEAKDYSDYPFKDYAHYEPTRALSLNLKARKSAPGSCPVNHFDGIHSIEDTQICVVLIFTNYRHPC